MSNLRNLVRPDIVEMKPYTPIVPFEVLSMRLGRDPEDIVKLDANENPYGPSPKAMQAMREGRYFNIYPDPEATQLREALSDYVGVPAEYLVAGMGADELIDLVLRVILSPGDAVVDSPPSFGMYPFSATVNSGIYMTVNRKPDFSLDIEGIETAVHENPNVKLVFACSPNNPDGSVISPAELKRLLALPVLVMLDEAYVEFAAESGVQSCIDWVPEHKNLCVLRTFSKLAGLAGLRVGYGAFPHWLRDHMMKIKQPYNINVAAGLAAVGALSDQEWLHDNVKRLVAERQKMSAALEKYDFLRPYPSYSNFVLCDVIGRDAGELKLKLQNEYGILVRYYNKPLMKNFIRISAGRPEQTAQLLAALDEIASQA